MIIKSFYVIYDFSYDYKYCKHGYIPAGCSVCMRPVYFWVLISSSCKTIQSRFLQTMVVDISWSNNGYFVWLISIQPVALHSNWLWYDNSYQDHMCMIFTNNMGILQGSCSLTKPEINNGYHRINSVP